MPTERCNATSPSGLRCVDPADHDGGHTDRRSTVWLAAEEMPTRVTVDDLPDVAGVRDQIAALDYAGRFLAKLLKQRDAARADVRRLTAERDAATRGHAEVVAALAERDALLTAERDRLHEGLTDAHRDLAAAIREREDATRAQQLAENDRAAAADEVRRLTADRDDWKATAEGAGIEVRRLREKITERNGRHRAEVADAEQQRDAARAALREIAEAPDDEDPAAAGIRLRAVARRALGEDTP